MLARTNTDKLKQVSQGNIERVEPSPAAPAKPKSYFVALCRYDGEVHNFAMVGSFDNTGYKINYAAGKVASEYDTTICSIFVKRNAANLMVEPVAKPHHAYSYKIHYQAYEITEAQFALFSSNYEESSRIGSKRVQVMMNNAEFTGPVTSFNNVSINNTCRHAALDIMKCTGIEMPKISKHYMGKLHNTTDVAATSINSPFFVLPVNPSKTIKQNDPLRYAILNDLHQAMTRLAKTKFGKELAAEKVNALRGLYNRIRDTEDNSALAIQMLIADWGNEKSTSGISNLALINRKRSTPKFSIFGCGKATTAKAFDRLNARLDKIANIRLS